MPNIFNCEIFDLKKCKKKKKKLNNIRNMYGTKLLCPKGTTKETYNQMLL